jgi:glucose/arabinose dehydrogenase
MKKIFILSLLSAFFVCVQAQTITTSLFLSGMNRVVDIQHAGDERLFLVEKAGIIKISNLSGVLNAQPFLDISSIVESSGNEQGLLGLAFHPNYKSNRYFYVNYTNLAGNSVVARYQTSASNPDSAIAGSAQILLTYNQPFSNHNGGSMNFGPDGFLYISTGDGGSGGDPLNNGQNPLTRLGKILRIDVDGAFPFAIPECNPYNNNPQFLPEIWAWGLRNPWRCSFDRLTGDYWIADVGQGNSEEINRQLVSSLGGENYGWRCYEGTLAFNTAGCQPQSSYVSPVYEYPHTGPLGGCSVIGGHVYRGAKHADMFGRYFFGDYCSGVIFSTDVNSLNTTTHGAFSIGTYTCFGTDVYGELYAAIDGNGQILKIGSTDCNPVASFSLTDTLTFCSAAPYILRSVKSEVLLSYEWYFNGTLINGANGDTLVVTQPGNYSLKVMASPTCMSQSANVYVRFGTPATTGFTGLPANTCVNYPPISLNGVPVGGVFTGHGMTGNTFNPSMAGVGTHCITYTFTNAQGCTSKAVQSILVEPCTGIEEWPYDGWLVYPNPAADVVYIKPQNRFSGNIEVQISDAAGRKISSEIRNVLPGQPLSLQIASLSSGFYFLKIKYGQKTGFFNLVIGAKE